MRRAGAVVLALILVMVWRTLRDYRWQLRRCIEIMGEQLERVEHEIKFHAMLTDRKVAAQFEQWDHSPEHRCQHPPTGKDAV